MMNSENIKIKLATKYDVDQILNIIYQKCVWLKENNIDQWDIENYIKIYNKKYFLNMINDEKLFIAQLDNIVIGVFLLKSTDVEYWENKTDLAFYIHHLATKNGFKGLGKIIIDFCIEYSKNNKKDYLRLDCKSDNKKLNNYYEKMGFLLKGSGNIYNYSYNLRELKLQNSDININKC